MIPKKDRRFFRGTKQLSKNITGIEFDKIQYHRRQNFSFLINFNDLEIELQQTPTLPCNRNLNSDADYVQFLGSLVMPECVLEVRIGGVR